MQAAVIQSAAAVERYLLDLLGLSGFRNSLAYPSRTLGHRTLSVGADSCDIGQGLSLGVVNHLGDDMAQADSYRQPRAIRRTGNPGANASVTANKLFLFRLHILTLRCGLARLAADPLLNIFNSLALVRFRLL